MVIMYKMSYICVIKHLKNSIKTVEMLCFRGIKTVV